MAALAARQAKKHHNIRPCVRLNAKRKPVKVALDEVEAVETPREREQKSRPITLFNLSWPSPRGMMLLAEA